MEVTSSLSEPRTYTKTPAELGFQLPPEWHPQERIWLSWPEFSAQHWGGDQQRQRQVLHAFAQFAAKISHFQALAINASGSSHPAIRHFLNQAKADLGQVELFAHPHDDVWCRDHGPLFLTQDQSGEVAVSNWQFNAWGGKFAPWNQDNEIPSRIAASLGLQEFIVPLVLEGGAIEVNGCGQLLTTEAVLLNPNRNPQLSRSEVETALKSQLGIKEVLWLAKGLIGDDTDGHIDDLARFANNETILACREADTKSPNHAILEENWQRLNKLRTPDDKPFELIALPQPEPITPSNWRLPALPASYANFLILNDAVLVPTFRQKERDKKAIGIIQEQFSQRQVLGVDSLEFIYEGGALHCLSMQQPIGVTF